MRTLGSACLGLLTSSLWSHAASARDTAGPEKPADTPARTVETKPVNETSVAAATTAPVANTLETSIEPSADPLASRTEEAKRLYALGAEAFAARRNADAIRYFRRAAALVPSAKLTYNIALTYEELGDTGRALAEYHDYLQHETDEARVAEVRGRVRELERKLGETGVQLLTVSSRPAGAVVKLAGAPVGITPWSGELTPGTHQLTLELEGYEPSQSHVVLPAERAAELAITLEARAAPERSVKEPAAVRPLTWSFLGVGVGALAGGVAFELSRAESSERAGRSASPTSAAEARGAADAKQMASLVLSSAGTAFLIGGGVLLLLDLSATTEKTSAATHALSNAQIGLPCCAGFCGVVTGGNF